MLSASRAPGISYDLRRIFNYVHDQIRYVHYFGSLKGAELTLSERSGNDFGQCALLSPFRPYLRVFDAFLSEKRGFYSMAANRSSSDTGAKVVAESLIA